MRGIVDIVCDCYTSGRSLILIHDDSHKMTLGILLYPKQLCVIDLFASFLAAVRYDAPLHFSG